MENQLKQIISFYGIKKQLKYIHSEYFELDEAIINGELKDLDNNAIKHIAEELADVMVMLEQFRLHYGIDKETIQDLMEYKINRQIERIENEG